MSSELKDSIRNLLYDLCFGVEFIARAAKESKKQFTDQQIADFLKTSGNYINKIIKIAESVNLPIEEEWRKETSTKRAFPKTKRKSGKRVPKGTECTAPKVKGKKLLKPLQIE